jgi:hypothetical protein
MKVRNADESAVGKVTVRYSTVQNEKPGFSRACIITVCSKLYIHPIAIERKKEKEPRNQLQKIQYIQYSNMSPSHSFKHQVP